MKRTFVSALASCRLLEKKLVAEDSDTFQRWELTPTIPQRGGYRKAEPLFSAFSEKLISLWSFCHVWVHFLRYQAFRHCGGNGFYNTYALICWLIKNIRLQILVSTVGWALVFFDQGHLSDHIDGNSMQQIISLAVEGAPAVSRRHTLKLQQSSSLWFTLIVKLSLSLVRCVKAFFVCIVVTREAPKASALSTVANVLFRFSRPLQRQKGNPPCSVHTEL